MDEPTDFPKMLLREGSALEWEGGSYDTLIVHDAEELAAAKKEGWFSALDAKKPAAKK